MGKAINSYLTLTEFLQWVTPQDTSADATDDAVIEDILETVSRYMDGETGRTFYPRIETRYYDSSPGREIKLDDDLLEIISVTNADGTALASTDYNLIPRNLTPYYGIRITKGSIYYWNTNTTDIDEFSIDINATWGYREHYDARAWRLVGTLNAAIADTTTTSFTMTAGFDTTAGKIIKIEDEILLTETVTTETDNTGSLTVKARGDNGSTAATHINGSSVYEWMVQEDIGLACKLIAQNLYRRWGNKAGQQVDENIVTATGIVITPRDIPTVAKNTMNRYRRRF